MILAADWPAPPGVIAGCTTRAGGVSDGVYESLNLGAHVGDEPRAVVENRRRLASELDLPSEPLWLTQVHGTDVVVDPEPATEADAALTRRPGTVCIVTVADCLPVLFTTDDGSEVAAAHAGWRGLCGGILENTVASFSLPPDRLLAWLGPAISQPAFEVGDEVRTAFLHHDADAAASFIANERGRWQADLNGLARQRLEKSGVSRIFGGGHCTSTESADFFSYRRDGQCGRMGGFVFCRTETA